MEVGNMETGVNNNGFWENLGEWSKTRKGKGAIAVFALVVIVLVVLIIVVLVNRETAVQRQEYEPEVDPYSGETIWNIDQQPEVEPELTLIGFQRLLQFGVMSKQYAKIVETVETYMETNYPEVLRINFWEETFKYLNEDMTLIQFKFVADNGDTHVVTLDTGGSISEVNVTIE